MSPEPELRLLDARPRHPKVGAYVRAAQPPMRVRIEVLVDLIRKAVPRSYEAIHRDSPTFCIGLEAFCFVTATSEFVELGFFEGALLPDPDGLLSGAQPRIRHLRLAEGTPIPKRKLTRLIQSAAIRMKGYRPPRHG